MQSLVNIGVTQHELAEIISHSPLLELNDEKDRCCATTSGELLYDTIFKVVKVDTPRFNTEQDAVRNGSFCGDRVPPKFASR